MVQRCRLLTIIFLAVLLHVDLQLAFRCLAVGVTICVEERVEGTEGEGEGGEVLGS